MGSVEFTGEARNAMELDLITEHDRQTPSEEESRFGVGVEDIVIAPLVIAALCLKRILRRTLIILIDIIDYAFPIFLRLMRFPLFTIRIIGDGVVGALKFIVGHLPAPQASRQRWREAVGRYWLWLRQKLSYKAFEEAVHHAFENGMAWVFRTCRNLTPLNALLTIFGAVLWLPISFGAATVLHMTLIAKAASLPAWMQLLHPVATLIAKSKLLVLPVYPAAWPQAKKHGLVQAMFQLYRTFAALYLIRKTAYRYGQAEEAAEAAGKGLGRAAARVGLAHVWDRSLAAFNSAAAWAGGAARAGMTRAAAICSATPLIGPLLQNYAARYEAVSPAHEEKVSEKVRGFFGRWSIKFSAEYYEAKEKEEAAQRCGGHS